MKLIFMGTPDFAAVVLKRLLKDFDVAAVVTGLDKPSGRGYAARFSPVKELCLERGIPILQYAKVSRDGIDDIRALKPDLIITAAFGQILSEEFLRIAPHGVLNVHASLLPKYRGAAPIQWAVINGDDESGITIMRTVKDVDAGDILLQKAVKIDGNETAGELFDRLAVLGGEALTEAIKLVAGGKAVFTPQSHEYATRVPMLAKEDGEIDFSKTARELKNFVRGMIPWPSAYAWINEKRLNVFAAEETAEFGTNGAAPGTVLAADCKNGLLVAVGDGTARLKELRLEGRNCMTDTEFLRGYNIPVGTILNGKNKND